MMLHDTTTETETAYTDFLVTKRLQDSPSGMDVPLDQISPVLFPFQRALVRWALRRGRAGLFAHTGLGKGLMLLEWAQQVPGEDPVLIVAPLAVTHQLVRESQQKFARAIQYMRHPEEATAHVLVTNYAMMHHFFTLPLSGIVLDESSILKDVGSATLANVLTHFTHVPYRLCCTATPAPNDIAEMANHAEFLGIMKRTDMLSTFFVHDDEGWRLRGHAADAFYRWLASWAMLLRSPADIGFDGRAFVLPPLHIQHHILPSTYRRDGELFASLGLKGITDRAAVRRQVVAEKVARAVELAQQTDGAATIWCELNAESSALASALTPDAVEIVGSASAETKEAGILQFLDGQARLMISKPSICGHGLNLQQAHTAIFVGLTDSFESWFQTIRRHWRFGQTQPVTVHVVLSEHEVAILENVQRKEREVATMLDALIPHLTDLQQEALVTTEQARPQAGLTHHTGPDWNLYEGDCVEGLRHIPDASVGLSVFSPPFLSLYQYSPTERDLGNSRDAESFFTHMRYMADGLMRVTMPGRHVAMHVSQVPAMLVRDGWIGLKDFRGEMVRHMTAWGWIYHGEVVVWKNPQPLRDGTPVRTPTGWQPIESLDIGEEVIGADGHATTITAIPYRGMQPMYRVTMDDGGTVECGPGHQWTVRTSPQNPWQVLTLATILTKGLMNPSGYPRYEIPMMAPLDTTNSETKLPIHPQLLGALIADGNWAGQRAIALTKDTALVHALPIPDGYTWTPRPGSERAQGRTMTYGLVSNVWHENRVLEGLRQLGLETCRAWEKFIPSPYLSASLEMRRALLRGLLDGDGRIDTNGGMYYRTTSPRLAQDVQMLVQSLGGLTTIACRSGGHYGDGQQGRPLYEMSIRLAGDWCPFTLARKAQHWTSHRKTIRRHIVAIEPTGCAPCTCITVAAPDGLFITKDHIVTHNSQAIRIHAKGLAFGQLRKDASWMRPALADYILLFRKPGENPVPILPDISNEDWIKWASPVWMDIRETHTLNAAEAREADDDRHICPLQLDVIERCIRLWSNPGETICDPFAGIGSTGYVALQHHRRFVGCELKASYAATARKNLTLALTTHDQQSLFAVGD